MSSRSAVSPRSRSAPAADAAAPSRLERWLLRRALDTLGHPPVTLVLWNGEQVRGSDELPRARILLRDRALLREIVACPELAFGEGYVDGRLVLEGDLVEFVLTAFDASCNAARWSRPLTRALTWRPRFNSRGRARRNVRCHYDLGNDFYALWLDELMVYTCAYFEHPGESLEQAQRAKLEHVCRKLRLRPGERVVEAGCGWASRCASCAARRGVGV
jgi:cyclopropane-fatty-acyl-phospholipid synthase